MAQVWQDATIVNIEEHTALIRSFYFQVKSTDNFDFLPGQFVTLDLPIAEQKNRRWRSYSIASYDNKAHIFELLILLLEHGKGTDYLFYQALVGTNIQFRGPQGKFLLPSNLDRDIFFICTGTGIAPFRAMIRTIFNQSIPHKNLHLIFGCRFATDTIYEQEFIDLESSCPTFFYHRAFSRETNIKVEARQHSGYVHDVYKNLVKDTKQSAYFFLCGWQNMIDDAKKEILALGYEKNDIHLESYG
ncbi:MAG: FAD-dependent oxidoreductase [Phycisphaerales bacterium]|nr:FAD-dependent oxidoreductase [Phycisphaerales bacterium]